MPPWCFFRSMTAFAERLKSNLSQNDILEIDVKDLRKTQTNKYVDSPPWPCPAGPKHVSADVVPIAADVQLTSCQSQSINLSHSGRDIRFLWKEDSLERLFNKIGLNVLLCVLKVYKSVLLQFLSV